MVAEAWVLNSIPFFKKSVKLNKEALYVHEGEEFMAEFSKYCDSSDIYTCVHKWKFLGKPTFKKHGEIEHNSSKTLRKRHDKIGETTVQETFTCMTWKEN